MDGWADSTEQVNGGQPGKNGESSRGSVSGPTEQPLTNGNLRPRKYWEPKKLRERHKIAIRLQSCGMTNRQIAESLGYTESRVCIILRDPRAEVFRAEASGLIADGLDDITLRLKHYAGEALSHVVELMRTSGSDTVSQRSAFDILDRAGYNKVDKAIVATHNISDEKVAQLMGALEETQKVIDADYTVED